MIFPIIVLSIWTICLVIHEWSLNNYKKALDNYKDAVDDYSKKMIEVLESFGKNIRV
jgi:hypothetical protein